MRDTGEPTTAISQVYLTGTLDGVVKAWYKHEVQRDNMYLIKGKMRLALVDDRRNSHSYQEVVEYVIEDSHPHLVHIPPGIWHGFQAVDGDIMLIHMNSRPYDFESPDEVRLPPDTDLLPYKW